MLNENLILYTMSINYLCTYTNHYAYIIILKLDYLYCRTYLQTLPT